MENTKLVIGLVVVSLLVNMVTLSFVLTGGQAKPDRNAVGWSPRPKPGPTSQKMSKLLSQRLGLTKEQKNRFEAEDEQIRKEMELTQIKLKEISGQLKDEMRRDPADRDKIHAYLAQIDQLHQAAQIKRIDLLLDLRAMLNPDKRAQFDKMLEEGPGPRLDNIQGPKGQGDVSSPDEMPGRAGRAGPDGPPDGF